jgi:hypothetical protein
MMAERSTLRFSIHKCLSDEQSTESRFLANSHFSDKHTHL